MSTSDTASYDAAYRQGLDAGRVLYQRCGEGHPVFPPRPACPRCHDRALSWQEASGEATVYSATTISPRGAEPYTVVVLDTDEGYRMMSRVDGPAALTTTIGDRVRITVAPSPIDGQPLPLVATPTTEATA